MYQKLVLIGYLGGDPQMRYSPSGVAVTNFSVATSTSYKKDEEWVNKTTWFRCSAWGKFAEYLNERLHKGSLVYLEGELVATERGNPRVYQTSEGEAASSFEVKVDTIKLLSKDSHEVEEKEEEPMPF